MTPEQRSAYLRALASREGSLSARTREKALHGPRAAALESISAALAWLQHENYEQVQASLESLLWYMEGGEEAFADELAAVEHVELACDFWSTGS